jgi:hypothetical protein
MANIDYYYATDDESRIYIEESDDEDEASMTEGMEDVQQDVPQEDPVVLDEEGGALEEAPVHDIKDVSLIQASRKWWAPVALVCALMIDDRRCRCSASRRSQQRWGWQQD